MSSHSETLADTRPTLTDTQLVLLSAASRCDDHLLIRPDTLKGGAAAKVAAALLRLGLVQEVAVGCDAPAWRTGEDERPFGLRLTPAGLTALGLEPPDAPEPASEGNGVGKPGASKAGSSAVSVGQPTPASPLRPGSKAALLLALLARPEGARLDELTAATGWLPHTARAALTGLRRRGHALTRDKDAQGRSTYRIGGSARG